MILWHHRQYELPKMTFLKNWKCFLFVRWIYHQTHHFIAPSTRIYHIPLKNWTLLDIDMIYGGAAHIWGQKEFYKFIILLFYDGFSSNLHKYISLILLFLLQHITRVKFPLKPILLIQSNHYACKMAMIHTNNKLDLPLIEDLFFGFAFSLSCPSGHGGFHFFDCK